MWWWFFKKKKMDVEKNEWDVEKNEWDAFDEWIKYTSMTVTKSKK
jgi:hypothetical protein